MVGNHGPHRRGVDKEAGRDLDYFDVGIRRDWTVATAPKGLPPSTRLTPSDPNQAPHRLLRVRRGGHPTAAGWVVTRWSMTSRCGSCPLTPRQWSQKAMTSRFWVAVAMQGSVRSSGCPSVRALISQGSRAGSCPPLTMAGSRLMGRWGSPTAPTVGGSRGYLNYRCRRRRCVGERGLVDRRRRPGHGGRVRAGDRRRGRPRRCVVTVVSSTGLP